MALGGYLNVQAANADGAIDYVEDAIARAGMPAYVMRVLRYDGDNPMGCMYRVAIEAGVDSDTDLFTVLCKIASQGRGLIRLGLLGE